jgi:ParB family chromosome partitioning protein
MFAEIDLDLLELSRLRVQRGIPHPTPEEVDSLRLRGVVQPLCVRPIPGTHPQRYELLVGDTTWLAAQLVGIQRVPVFVRDDLSDEDARAIVEGTPQYANSDNPLARARMIRRLIESDPRFTHSQIAQRLGMTLSSLSHHLRLLKLPSEVQGLVEKGSLKYGHARALCALESRPRDLVLLARLVSRQAASVRRVEASVRLIIEGHLVPDEALRQTRAPVPGREEGRGEASSAVASTSEAPANKSADILRLEQSIAEQLGSTVEIEHRVDGSGNLIIRYHNLEILDGIVDRLGVGDGDNW